MSKNICYNGDASRLFGRVEKVIFPETIEEIQNIVKSSILDIVPRGAGTGFVGGCVPSNSIVVDLCKMNKVIEFSSIKKTISVEAGITLKELNEKLKAAGLEFPIIPSNNGISTIGGMIATNACGNRSMKYGYIKEWVEEIKLVNGKAEIIKLGKSDLSDACGMEGITGIIASATLKLIPIIKRSASAFQSDSLDEVLSISRKLKSEKDVTMILLIPPYVSGFFELPERYNLIIEFEGERGKIQGKEYEELIKLKERLFYSLFEKEYFNIEDPKLFFDKIKDFIAHLEENKTPYFGDLGVGVVQGFFKDSEKSKRKAILDLIKHNRIKPGKYGIGITRKDLFDSFEIKMIQRVKSRHDPHGKINKGKMIDYESEIRRTIIDNSEERVMKTGGPKIGEEISAEKLKKEIEEKTPEEKLNEFIQKEKIRDVAGERLFDKNGNAPDEETTKLLLDYEQTFDSELRKDKVKQVEEIAKKIPKQITLQEMPQNPKKNETSKNERDLINSIMGNKFGKGFAKKDKEKK